MSESPQFNLTGLTLWVVPGAVLDYESGVTSYLVKVLILDNGSPPMNTTYGFAVEVCMCAGCAMRVRPGDARGVCCVCEGCVHVCGCTMCSLHAQ